MAWKNLKIGDIIKIHQLITEVKGFYKIGENQMVETEYGGFNIDIVEKQSTKE